MTQAQKSIHKKVLLASLVTASLASCLSSHAFDFGVHRLADRINTKVRSYFDKPVDLVPVRILPKEGEPVIISRAEVIDRGTQLTGMRDIKQSFIAVGKNVSRKEVESFQLLWERRVPFKSYEKKTFIVNSKGIIKPGQSEEVSFRYLFDDRKDTSFNVKVERVMFTDGEVWNRELTGDEILALEIIKQQLKQAAEDEAIENGEEPPEVISPEELLEGQ